VVRESEGKREEKGGVGQRNRRNKRAKMTEVRKPMFREIRERSG
jgi:hypothetical protein